MPDPIPRNRSADRSRPRRLTRRPRDWPGRLFRQRRENAQQPAPPPAQPRTPAHRQRAQGAWLGRPFGQRRENVEHPVPAPAQPRPPAARRPAHRQRVRPRGPLHQRQGNVQRPGPRPPRPRWTRSSSQVVVGVLLCAVAALVVGIVVPPLFPSDTSPNSVVAAPASGQAGVAAVGSGDPDQPDGEIAAPPAVPSADRVQTQPTPALVGNRTAVPPGRGASAPAGQPDPPTEPSPPADLGQRVDQSVDEPQRTAERLANTESDQRRQTNPKRQPQPEPEQPTKPPPGPSDDGDATTRAKYEQQVRQIIERYQSSSPGSKSGGGNGRSSEGTGSSGKTDSGGGKNKKQSGSKSAGGGAKAGAKSSE